MTIISLSWVSLHSFSTSFYHLLLLRIIHYWFCEGISERFALCHSWLCKKLYRSLRAKIMHFGFFSYSGLCITPLMRWECHTPLIDELNGKELLLRSFSRNWGKDKHVKQNWEHSKVSELKPQNNTGKKMNIWIMEKYSVQKMFQLHRGNQERLLSYLLY